MKTLSSKFKKQQLSLLKEFQKVEVLFTKVQKSWWWRSQRLKAPFQRFSELVETYQAACQSEAPSAIHLQAIAALSHAEWVSRQLEVSGIRKPKAGVLSELQQKLGQLQRLCETLQQGHIAQVEESVLERLKGTPADAFDAEHLKAISNKRAEAPTYEAYKSDVGLHGFSPHPLFDAVWYKKTYLENDATAPFEHFMRRGWLMGHKPYEAFNEAEFLDFVRPILVERGINPLLLHEQDKMFRQHFGDALVSYQDWIQASAQLNPCKISSDLTKPFKVRVLGKGREDADETLRSLKEQSYLHWENVSDRTTSIEPEDWWVYVLPQYRLAPEAFQELANAIRLYPDAQAFYADEDSWADGARDTPYFKTDFQLEQLQSQAYLGGLLVLRGAALLKLRECAAPENELELWEFTLHLGQMLRPAQVVHVPKILSHRLDGEASPLDLIHGGEASKAMMERYAKSYELKASVRQNQTQTAYLAYDLPSPQPKVSLIIPTKNKLEYLERCVTSVVTQSTYENYEILIVDNGSDEAECLAWLREVSSTHPKVRVLHYSHPFNYSAINNFAVSHSTGEVLLLLNNDTKVIDPDWLEQMISLAVREDVGCVGALLLFPNETLQHAGILMGLGGVANHAFLQQPATSTGYHGNLQYVTEVDGVTAACLAIRKSVYLEVGGLDEVNLKVAFNDVDFCLKVSEAGYRNLLTPFARLYHYESVSRGAEDTPEKYARFKQEVLHMQERWASRLAYSKYYNVNLSHYPLKTYKWSWPPRSLPEPWNA